jgi:hypothetical protein
MASKTLIELYTNFVEEEIANDRTLLENIPKTKLELKEKAKLIPHPEDVNFSPSIWVKAINAVLEDAHGKKGVTAAFQPEAAINKVRVRNAVLPMDTNIAPGGLLNSKTSQSPKSVIMSGTSTLDDNNLSVDGYVPAEKPENFETLSAGNAPNGVEQSVLVFMVGKVLFNSYFDALDARDKAIEAIIAKNPAAKGKQSLKIEKRDGKDCYTLLDAKVPGRVVCEPSPELETVMTYDQVFAEVKEAWRVNKRTCDYLGVFELPIINSQSVIHINELKKGPLKGFEDSLISSFSNTFSTASNVSQQVLDELGDAIGAAVGGNETFYQQIVRDMSSFQGSVASGLIQKMFQHRLGIVHHQSINTDFKKECWMKAKANVDQYHQYTIVKAEGLSERELVVVKAWKKILESRFMYHVFMNGGKPSDIVGEAIKKLLDEGMSSHLFMTALYPIAWVCTPLWWGYPSMAVRPYSTEAGYRKEIGRLFIEFANVSSGLCASSKGLLLYYKDQSGTSATANLFHHWFMRVSTEKRDKGSKSSKGSKAKGGEDVVAVDLPKPAARIRVL